MSSRSNPGTLQGRLQSTLKLVDSKDKLAIVLDLHGHFRNHVQFWHGQVFKAATWSMLSAYTLIAYHLDTTQGVSNSWVIILILIVAIAASSAAYLGYCENCYIGNWKQIVNCELALRVHEPNVYFAEYDLVGRKLSRAEEPRWWQFWKRSQPATSESGPGPIGERKPTEDGIPFERVAELIGMPGDDIRLIRRAHGFALATAVGLMAWLGLVSK